MGWNDEYKDIQFEVLKGKTLGEIRVGGDEVYLTTVDGEEFKLYHSQDCCESVGVEEVIGDVNDLLHSQILLAEEVSSTTPDEKAMAERRERYEKEGHSDYYSSFESWHDTYYESETWTFYKLSTIKGSVTIRFYGSSNGYYSESVSFVQVKDA